MMWEIKAHRNNPEPSYLYKSINKRDKAVAMTHQYFTINIASKC